MNPDPIVDVLIPARDEELGLPLVVGDIDRSIVRTIWVVDNGSTDRTADVARAAGCRVVSCGQPGYGRACLTGLAAMAGSPPDIVLFIDGDHSDDPRQIEALVEPIVTQGCDLVVGSRTLGGAEPGSLTLPQRVGNALATRLIRLYWSHVYSDLGPFRAVTWNALTTLDMKDLDFGWTIEMQIKAVQHGLRIVEIPVGYRPRVGRSKISGTWSGSLRAGWKILWTIHMLRFARAKSGR